MTLSRIRCRERRDFDFGLYDNQLFLQKERKEKKMSRILTAIGLAAVCALASANTAQVIADLEAKLADAQARAGVTINRSARDATV